MLCCCAGLLHALLLCAQTKQLVAKVVSGWKQQPLVAALSSQQVRLRAAFSQQHHSVDEAAACMHTTDVGAQLRKPSLHGRPDGFQPSHN